MNESVIDWTEKVRKLQTNSNRVLEVGSLNVNGTVKHLFSDAEEYIGIDFRDGKDVDIVMNAHDIPTRFMENSFDTVICMDMLEHDDRFWITLSAINFVLKPGGFLWIVMPTIDFPIHNHPGDYWRATEQAFRDVFFKGYDILSMEKVHTKELHGKKINHLLCAAGIKK